MAALANSSSEYPVADTWQPTAAREHRAHQRLAAVLPVHFRNAQGQHCATTLQDLSADGLKVRCNVATAQMIHPIGGRLTAENQSVLTATLALPLADGLQTIATTVRLRHVGTADSGPRCVLGFSFSGLSQPARERIEAFCREHGFSTSDTGAPAGDA